MNNKTNVFQGKKYRITVLTERLLRLEYSENGIFEDKLTEFVINRNFEIPEFSVEEDEKILKISTKYFSLFYKKNQNFRGNKINPASNLRIELLSADKAWYYGHPEIRNYGGIKPSLNSQIRTIKGLYSIDGFASFDDSNSRVMLESGLYSKRENNNIDIYLFMYRNDFQLALNDYFKLTGYPQLLPKYALGVWYSKDCKYTNEDIMKLIETFEKKEIPLSIILLDRYWHEQMLNDGKIDNTKYEFSDKITPEFLNFLIRHNIKLGLNIEPSTGIKYTNKFGDDYLVPYNILDDKFIKTLISTITLKYRNFGINLIWLDYRKEINDITILSKYLSIVNNFGENRQVVLSRGSLIAPHRNGIVYTGRLRVDYDTLAKLPYFTSRCANIGVSWVSSDVGGYYGGIEDDELYIRNVQFATFSPILRFHAGASEFYKKEPWNRSISTYYIVKSYLNLRYELIPYLYSEGAKYSFEAIPIIKPLYYTNKEVYDEPNYLNEYYFGSQMLISPITKKRDYTIKRVVQNFFLPSGIWYDFKSGKKYYGDKSYIGLYKKEDYPVFVKAGGIIPMNKEKNISNNSKLSIMIFPGRNNSYELYEDDGNTMLYKQGYYIVNKLEYIFNRNEFSFSIKPIKGVRGIVPDYRDYELIFRNIKSPNQVICKCNNTDINFKYENDGENLIVNIDRVSTVAELIVKVIGNTLEINNTKAQEKEFYQTLNDMPIETPLKQKISDIVFGKRNLKEKRIEIIKLKKLIPKNYFPLILKLLDYMHENENNIIK